MNVTCALALWIEQDGYKKFLLVHPTNSGHLRSWSLPKGLADEGESRLQAAVRECHEETGLDLNSVSHEFIELGVFPYSREKDYCLFVHEIKELDLSKLHCSTHFIDKKTQQQVLEVDRYCLVELHEALNLLNPKQAAILSGFKWRF